MAGLLEHDKTQTPESADAAAPAAPAETPSPTPPVHAGPACATCASPLSGGQDWCLECGSAQPGRLGARHGWRAALTVAGTCALLATGAGAAAYAALSTESQGIAQAPPPAPVVAQAPPAPAPPAEETPTVPAPASEPADVPEVKAPADAADEPGPSPSPSPSASAGTGAGDGSAAGGDSSSGGGGADKGGSATDGPVALDLTGDAASTYDPLGRGGGEVGDPADALDGRASTAWEAPAGADGEVRIGLAISLEKAQTLSRVAFQADTPGFDVELYGTRAASLPPSIADSRWERLDSMRDVGIREEFAVAGKYRHVVLWVTAQPADTKVAIPEIQLFD